jgi:VWFA-related protein
MVLRRRLSLGLVLVVAASAALTGQQATPETDGPVRFKTGVEFVNVTATVTDASGRFVPNLTRDDFVVYDNDVPQPVSHFSADRVPVSLGILLDTSGSMAGVKMDSARAALNRFLFDLLAADDDVFLYTFDDDPSFIEGWTTDRRRLTSRLARLTTAGGTAMYDAIAEALPMAASGRHAKKALVVISDGNDTSSDSTPLAVKQRLRESEVLLYAVGIDSDGIEALRETFPRQRPGWGPRQPTRRPPPVIPRGFPGRRPGIRPLLQRPPVDAVPDTTPRGRQASAGFVDERVNEEALRNLTDDSGGRTEIVQDAGDLDPATNRIAVELSRQYFLGYPSPAVKNGEWHTIRVEAKNPAYRVRARTGYIAN